MDDYVIDIPSPPGVDLHDDMLALANSMLRYHGYALYRTRWTIFGDMPTDEPMLSWDEWNALEDIGPFHGPWHHMIDEPYIRYAKGKRVAVPWPGRPAGKFRRG